MFKKLFVCLILSAAIVSAVPKLTLAAEGDPPSSSSTVSATGAACSDAVSSEKRNCTLAQRIADPSGFVYKSWRITRSIINILLIIALLIISFSNITRINIDTYTIKKALPNLVVGVILANASFLIIRYLADIATVTVYFFVERAGMDSFNSFTAYALGQLGENSIRTVGVGAGLGAGIIVLIMAIVAMIGILWMAFLLYVRLVAIYLLTILAPLAFVAYGLPGLEKYFKMWWQQFIKWLFMLTVMSAVLWLMYVIGTTDTTQSVARTLIMYVLFFLALTIPSKLGGSTIDKASSFFKQYSGVNAARKYGEGMVADSKERAALKLQQIGYRVPGIAKYQAWKELTKENQKKDVSRLKKIGQVQAADTKAGISKQKLEYLDREVSNQESIITARNASVAAEIRDAKGNRMIDREIRSEFDKKLAEARSKADSSNARFQFYSDDKNEEFLQEIYRAVINEETLAKQVDRSENDVKGGEVTRLLQVHRLQEDFDETSKSIETVEKDLSKARSDNDAIAINRLSGELETLKRDQNRREESFTQILKDDEVVRQKYQGINSLQGLQKVYDSNDAADVQRKKILQSEYKQVRKLFNEGINAQFEQDFKEKSVPALRRDMDKFFREKLSGEPEKIQAFLRGDTAYLSSVGIKAKDIREGVGNMEIYKQIMRNTNDIRHSDALTDFIDLHEQHSTEKIVTDNTEQILTDAKGNQNQRRAVAAYLSQQVGALSGLPNARVQNVQYSGISGPYVPPQGKGGQAQSAAQANTPAPAPPQAGEPRVSSGGVLIPNSVNYVEPQEAPQAPVIDEDDEEFNDGEN
jgi:hypothetical protein